MEDGTGPVERTSIRLCEPAGSRLGLVLCQRPDQDVRVDEDSPVLAMSPGLRNRVLCFIRTVLEEEDALLFSECYETDDELDEEERDRRKAKKDEAIKKIESEMLGGIDSILNQCVDFCESSGGFSFPGIKGIENESIDYTSIHREILKAAMIGVVRSEDSLESIDIQAAGRKRLFHVAHTKSHVHPTVDQCIDILLDEKSYPLVITFSRPGRANGSARAKQIDKKRKRPPSPPGGHEDLSIWPFGSCSIHDVLQKLQNEGEKKQREKEKRLEVLAMRRLGCERYECPGRTWDTSDTSIKQPLGVRFHSELPKMKDLAGTYEIFYYYSLQDIICMQRTTRGRLVLDHFPAESEEDIKAHRRAVERLCGQVQMHRTLYMEPFGGEFCFFAYRPFGAKTRHDFAMSSEREAPSDDSLLVGVAEYPNESMRGNKSRGKLKVVAERTAGGWNPNENYPCNARVAFESVAEADALLRQSEKSEFVRKSWLCNHMSLPESMAWEIHEFVAYMPLPAFVVEEGDLWLEIDWTPDRGPPGLEVTMVARRNDTLGDDWDDEPEVWYDKTPKIRSPCL